jgi:hypothetical protein
MCKSSSATEHPDLFGSFQVDSVVLRIMIQQDNCVCRVTIDNQIKPTLIGLRKYDGIIYSAPEQSVCGLAVDINHLPDISTGNVIAPIECIDNVEYRTIPLLQNSILQFKSRIINGKFTRGYCMRIQRGNVDCYVHLEIKELYIRYIYTTILDVVQYLIINGPSNAIVSVFLSLTISDTSRTFK